MRFNLAYSVSSVSNILGDLKRGRAQPERSNSVIMLVIHERELFQKALKGK